MRAARIGVLGLLLVANLAAQQGGKVSANRSSEHRLPFQARDGLIYIHVRVNGKPQTLLVDTGAVITVFTTKAVPTITVDSPIVLNMARGSVAASRLPVGLELGDASSAEPHYTFRLNAPVGAFKFMNAEGVVGLDVLSRFKSVKFDFKDSIMVLEDR
jgi:Retroviral aspartyl protease